MKGGIFNLDEFTIREEPWIARCVMSKLIVVRAEMMYASMSIQSIQYQAISDVFDEVPPGEEFPHYDVIIDDIDGITFKKR